MSKYAFVGSGAAALVIVTLSVSAFTSNAANPCQTGSVGTINLATPETDIVSPPQRYSADPSLVFNNQYVVEVPCGADSADIAADHGATVAFVYTNLGQHITLWNGPQEVVDPEKWVAELATDTRILDAYPVYEARVGTGHGDDEGEEQIVLDLADECLNPAPECPVGTVATVIAQSDALPPACVYVCQTVNNTAQDTNPTPPASDDSNNSGDGGGEEVAADDQGGGVKKTARVAGFSTVVRPAHINAIFRSVYFRNPSVSENRYWLSRLKDKPTLVALKGAMAWHKLHSINH